MDDYMFNIIDKLSDIDISFSDKNA